MPPLRLCDSRPKDRSGAINAAVAQVGPMKVLVIVALDGGVSFVTDGPAEIITVCDWAPSDRLYLATDMHEVSAARVAEIIGSDAVGSKFDDRHSAIENRIVTALDGKRRFSVVPAAT
jgi:hypothetical protein